MFIMAKEIGMLGKKPDPNIREPFLWEEKEKDIVRPSWMEPEFTTDSTVQSLSIQIDNPQSVYNHYRNGFISEMEVKC